MKKLKEKLLAWLKKRPPKLGPDTIKIIAEDFRKGGLGLMATGLVGLLQVVAKFTLGGAVVLFFVGFLFWAVAIVLHSIYERAQPKE